MNIYGYIVIGLMGMLPALGTGCRSENKYQHVDFSNRVAVGNVAEPLDPGKKSPLKVVISSIFSAQESFSHYNDLFEYIGRECAIPLKITYCKSNQEAYQLFAAGLADVGLMETAIYIIGKRNRLFKTLVIPVVHGKTTFQAYIIVHEPSPNRVFSDLNGKSFAFTDRASLTGYLYAFSRSGRGTNFWRKTVFAGSHDNAIDLVERGIVDGASVSSNVFDEIRRDNPEKTDHVRIIEKSESFGMPPIVIRLAMPPPVETSLRNAFLNLKSESRGWELLQVLGIDTFTFTDDTLYASAVHYVPGTIVP